jgi:hypothetical protein
MLQIAFVIVLAMLWALTFAQPGGADFLKVHVFQRAAFIVRVIDVLTGLAIVGLMVTMRGPLALTAAALLVLWLLTLLGIPQIAGVSLGPIIVLVIIMGATVHIVTHKSS